MVVLSSRKLQCALYLFGSLIKFQFLKETSYSCTLCHLLLAFPVGNGIGHEAT